MFKDVSRPSSQTVKIDRQHRFSVARNWNRDIGMHTLTQRWNGSEKTSGLGPMDSVRSAMHRGSLGIATYLNQMQYGTTHEFDHFSSDCCAR